MCTSIFEQTPVRGSGKGSRGWFVLEHANVSYDHPFHAPMEHALTVDFVNDSVSDGGRVAVELSRDSARDLAARIIAALDAADAYEGVDPADAAP